MGHSMLKQVDLSCSWGVLKKEMEKKMDKSKEEMHKYVKE